MYLEFYKYHGTGNDFILIDNRDDSFNAKNIDLIKTLGNRQLGIGADGIILLENSDKYDFKMVYYNTDGSTGSMCGNGGRCIVAFAKMFKIIEDDAVFEAADGIHKATIDKNDVVNLQLMDVGFILEDSGYLFLNTGSPHHVQFVSNVSKIKVKSKGKKIRNSSTYSPKGTNVNFVEQINKDTFKVRTYERGVEDETLSCGTGVTAVAIAAYQIQKTTNTTVNVETNGGLLEVSFLKADDSYTNIYLRGATKLVYKGFWVK
ncbi:MAG: diaminopimelate epimerase [Flavobacteriaceae bacterium]